MRLIPSVLKVSDENFLNIYEPVDFNKDEYWLDLKERYPEFYEAALEIQNDVLEGRADNRERLIQFMDENLKTKFYVYFNGKGYFQAHDFVKEKIFRRRPRLVEVNFESPDYNTLRGFFKKSPLTSTSTDEEVSSFKNKLMELNKLLPEDDILKQEISSILLFEGNIFASRSIALIKKFQNTNFAVKAILAS